VVNRPANPSFCGRWKFSTTGLLKEQKLGKEAIKKVILVGGPTLAPYFREILAGEDLEFRWIQQALTRSPLCRKRCCCVRRTQRLNARGCRTSSNRRIPAVNLPSPFKPVGLDSAPMVGGKVSGASTQDLAGFTLELVNTKTQWRSGKSSLKPDWRVSLQSSCREGSENTYQRRIVLTRAGESRNQT